MLRTADPDMTRQVCRLGGIYLVDRARYLARAVDSSFVTALVFMAVSRANVGGIAGSQAASARYLALRDVPPDEVRLPVSVYALARDLCMPYETVRRHVGKLRDWGVCATVADGIIVPSHVFHSAEAQNGARETERATRTLVAELARSGVRARNPGPAAANDVTLQLARLSTHYFVDGISLVSRLMNLDVLSTLVMITIGLMNTQAITRDLTLVEQYSGLNEIPSDDLRMPVKAYALSRFLMLPYETARRTALRLIERGLVSRDAAGGLTMPSEVFARPDMMALFVEFAAQTQAFLESLAEHGVTGEAAAPQRHGMVDRAEAAWRRGAVGIYRQA